MRGLSLEPPPWNCCRPLRTFVLTAKHVVCFSVSNTFTSLGSCFLVWPCLFDGQMRWFYADLLRCFALLGAARPCPPYVPIIVVVIACLLICLLVDVLAYRLDSLLVHLHACMIRLLACLLACFAFPLLLSCLPACLNACLFACRLSCLLA